MEDKLKTYYQDNKDGLIQKKKEKIYCDKCGRDVRRDGISEHKKSKRCIRDGRVITMFVDQEKEKREIYNMGLEDKY